MASSSLDVSGKGKKRKSMAAESGSGGVEVIVGEFITTAGPVFVNFPCVRPSKNTPFTLYTRDTASSHDISKQKTLIAGETEDVEYFSSNRGGGNAGAEGQDCQYLPALFNPQTNTLHLPPTAPLYLLSHSEKRLKTLPLPSSSSKTPDYRAKRIDLGEAFGTRKAKSQIKTDERNKVDVSAMEGVRGHFMETIGESKAVEKTIPPSELIPVPNVNTSDVNEVYSRDALIPPAEWSAMDVSGIMKARDDRARVALLPWRRSRWIEDKMRGVMEGPMSGSSKRSALKLLFHLSLLLNLNDLSNRLSKLDISEITAKFPSTPSQCVNGVLTRFAESGGKKWTVTEKGKVKLLAWICCLYLCIEGWSIEIGKVAKDLSITPAKVADMYKSLGCVVTLPSPEERERMGVSIDEARANRRAVLRAPVVFPKPKTRAAAKR